MVSSLLVIISITLFIIAGPVVWFLAKKLKHGLKHVFLAVLVSVMLTSLIQLGIFYFVMKYKVFEILCNLGFDCNNLFSNFLKISIYSSIAIFAFIISIYYIFKILKGIFKWGILIFGVVIIIIACGLVYNMYFSGNHTEEIIDKAFCNTNNDCVLMNSTNSLVAINSNYIKGWQEDIPNSIVQNNSCDYEARCINKKCIVNNLNSCEVKLG